MNIYKREFSALLRSVMVWSISIAAIILVFTALYPAFAAETEAMSQLIENFPEELLIAFGMTDMDFTSIIGIFGMEFVFVQICLAIQAANYGFSLVSVEETDRTADFLLSKPVKREQIMTSKLLAAISGLAITNIVVWVSSFLFLTLFSQGDGFDARPVISLLLSMAVFQLFFLSVGIVISLLVKRIRNVTPYSMGLVFGLYILNAFGDMMGEKSFEVISPFNHFAPSAIVRYVSWDVPMVMISVVIILVSIAASYFLYMRRNIPSVV